LCLLREPAVKINTTTTMATLQPQTDQKGFGTLDVGKQIFKRMQNLHGNDDTKKRKLSLSSKPQVRGYQGQFYALLQNWSGEGETWAFSPLQEILEVIETWTEFSRTQKKDSLQRFHHLGSYCGVVLCRQRPNSLPDSWLQTLVAKDWDNSAQSSKTRW